jgi:hypothetical protein
LSRDPLRGDPPRESTPAPPPLPPPSPPALLPALAAARAPARLLSALCQNALNSNGCRYRRPYTKRPAGRWFSVTLPELRLNISEEAPDPEECVLHAEV